MIRVYCRGQRKRISDESGADAGYSSHLRCSFSDRLANPRARDLLRIGQAAFLADRSFRRRQDLGRQTRGLRVVVPVEQPTLWRDVAHLLAGLAEFVSRDHWTFQFARTRGPGPRLGHSVSVPERASVNLFSDGLDSLCGAAAALRRWETPILVSHSPPGIAHVSQSLNALRSSLKRDSMAHWWANVHFIARDRDASGRRHGHYPERSRLTRPMLYLCMAGAVALELDVPHVFLNENGVMAVNLPFFTGTLAPLVTRHAHPMTLRRFNDILSSVWPHDSVPVVGNRLHRFTKGDQLRLLAGGSHLAPDTMTCHFGRQQMARVNRWLLDHGRIPRPTRECGLCYPCLVRRSAIAFARISEGDHHYAFDARATLCGRDRNADAPLYSLLASNVVDFHRFCVRMKGLSPRDFTTSYLSQLALVCGRAKGAGDSVRETYRLYRRFARQSLDYLEGT